MSVRLFIRWLRQHGYLAAQRVTDHDRHLPVEPKPGSDDHLRSEAAKAIKSGAVCRQCDCYAAPDDANMGHPVDDPHANVVRVCRVYGVPYVPRHGLLGAHRSPSCEYGAQATLAQNSTYANLDAEALRNVNVFAPKQGEAA